MNRLVVVSNRVPTATASAPAGGLAVALDGLMEKRGGLWFGWSGAVVAGAGGGICVRHDSGVDYATIDLTQEEHDRYYNNFANGVLWPLLHTMPELMHFDRRDARVYREVNARMAAALQPLLRPTDLVWVHDYHLLPLAAALRARGVGNPIGFFLHVPFASADVLAAAPEMGGAGARDARGRPAGLPDRQRPRQLRRRRRAVRRGAAAARQRAGGRAPPRAARRVPRRDRAARFRRTRRAHGALAAGGAAAPQPARPAPDPRRRPARPDQGAAAAARRPARIVRALAEMAAPRDHAADRRDLAQGRGELPRAARQPGPRGRQAERRPRRGGLAAAALRLARGGSHAGRRLSAPRTRRAW